MLRQEVLKLYRDIHRTIKKVPEEWSRRELKDWARRDFRHYKNLTDEHMIKSMLVTGQRSLSELKTSLELSGSK